MNTRRRRFLHLAAATSLLPALARAQSRNVRLRGKIEELPEGKLVLRERSGQRRELALAPNCTVTEVHPVTLADIKPGTFVGVGGLPQPDGTQRAIAVVLFPENMRGTGEGHHPFDFLPQSTMTNATVTDVAKAPQGERLQLRYENGEQTIVVQEIDGKPTVVRVNAGRNGFAPPY